MCQHCWRSNRNVRSYAIAQQSRATRSGSVQDAEVSVADMSLPLQVAAATATTDGGEFAFAFLCSWSPYSSAALLTLLEASGTAAAPLAAVGALGGGAATSSKRR